MWDYWQVMSAIKPHLFLPHVDAALKHFIARGRTAQDTDGGEWTSTTSLALTGTLQPDRAHIGIKLDENSAWP